MRVKPSVLQSAAQALGISGVGIILYQFAIYPWLSGKIGIVKLQHRAGYLVVAIYLILPNAAFLSWNESSLLVVSVVLLVLLECSTSAVSENTLKDLPTSVAGKSDLDVGISPPGLPWRSGQIA